MIISFLPEVGGNTYTSAYNSLCNCALVCRNWLPASRHNLLTNVRIKSDQRYALFVNNVIRSQNRCSFLPSIRQFSLFCEPSNDLSDSQGIRSAARLFIFELGSQCQNLEVLRLEHVDFDMSSLSPRKFAALSAFASVRALRLFGCRFLSFAIARYTLISLPSLDDLTLQGTTWLTAGGPEPLLPFLRTSIKSPCLRTIRCLTFLGGEATCDDQMLQWLSTTSLAVSLSDLRVSFSAFTKAPAIWEYIGPVITQLSIWTLRGEELLHDST